MTNTKDIKIEEVIDTLKNSKVGKAVRYDQIRNEKFKFASEKGVELIHRLISMEI